jgi:hypothetical protein
MVKPEVKRLLGKPICRLKDNVKLDHEEIGWGGVDWIHLAQYRNQWFPLVNMLMKLRIPLHAGYLMSG